MTDTDKARDILLLGSSIMEQWSNAGQALAPHRVNNRAIGGTTTSDWLRLMQPIVAESKADRIIFYVGSNDKNQAASPEQVIRQSLRLRSQLSECMPALPVAWIGIMRCPQKLAHWQRIDEINSTIAQGLEAADCMVDVNPGLACSTSGDPRYVADDLHLSDFGYSAFSRQISAQLAGWL